MDDEEQTEKNRKEYYRRFGWLNFTYDYEADQWVLLGENKEVPLFENVNIETIDGYIKSSLELDRDLLVEQSELFAKGVNMSDWEKESRETHDKYYERFGWVSVGYDWPYSCWTLRKFQGEKLKTFRLPVTMSIGDVESLMRSSLELDRDVLFENSKLSGGKFIKERECPPGVVY